MTLTKSAKAESKKEIYPTEGLLRFISMNVIIQSTQFPFQMKEGNLLNEITESVKVITDRRGSEIGC